MYFGFEQSVTGNPDIDLLKGVQEVAVGLPLEQKLKRIKQVLRVAPPSSLPGNCFSIDAGLGFASAKDLPPEIRDPIQDLSMIGRVSLSETFKYLEDEDVPIDSLAINVVEPIFIGFNPSEVLTYVPETLSLPVTHIYQFRPAAEAA